MAKITEGLAASIKSAVKGGLSASKVSATKDEVTPIMKIIGKNFMTLPGIARDMNVARQNTQKLVKIMGGEPSRGADAFFLKQSEREKSLEVQMGQEEPKVVAEPPKKEESPIAKLMKQFSGDSILKSVTKYLAIGAAIAIIWTSFKDEFVKWAENLWETIKEKFDEWVGEIKTWFNDTIVPIIEKVKSFIDEYIIQPVSNFFKNIGDWFVEKFNSITGLIEPAMAFVQGIIEKVMGVVNAIKEKVGAVVEGAKNIVSGAADKVKSFFGFGKKEEPAVDDTAEKEKLLRQQKEAQETERVKKLEKEKQYTGEDEIVRKRLELPEKTETMKREEKVAVAPPPEPIVVPGPPPIVKETPVAIPKAKVEEIQKPITVQPPTPTGKAAEGPEKQVGGSLSSVVTAQSGVDMSGFHPEFQKRLTAMATAFQEQTGKKLLVTSGYRSNEKQAELFNAKLKQLGGDRAATRKKVAEPMPPLGKGRGSFHLKGLAIDVNSKGAGGINALAGDRESPTGWLEAFGLTRPVRKENWHIQPMGTLPTADNPENPGAPVLVAGKDSKPMNLAEGKKESIGQPEPTSTAASGSQVASASNDLASGQRQQQKPSTPIIVNAPVTNTTTVTQKKIAVSPPKQDSVRMLTARLT